MDEQPAVIIQTAEAAEAAGEAIEAQVAAEVEIAKVQAACIEAVAETEATAAVAIASENKAAEAAHSEDAAAWQNEAASLRAELATISAALLTLMQSTPAAPLPASQPAESESSEATEEFPEAVVIAEAEASPQQAPEPEAAHARRRSHRWI